MHQEHNIAWNKFASNLTFISHNPRCTPTRTDLFPQIPRCPTRKYASKSRSNTKDLESFVSSVIKTLTPFSQTERGKYPSAKEIGKKVFPTSGRLYSDELRERYPEFLNENNQMIQYWIDRAQNDDRGTVAHAHRRAQADGSCHPDSLQDKPWVTYSLFHADLADVVKILIYENQLETLLMLSHHPQIPLARLPQPEWTLPWSRLG